MQKSWKTKTINPKKWCSRRGETSRRGSAGISAEVCVLQGIRMMFALKKSALVGSILAPFGRLMFPNPIFYNEFEAF